MTSLLLLVLLLVIVIEPIFCLHFLGGTITWRPVNASAAGPQIAVIITQTYSWTHNLMSCSNPLIATGGPVPDYAGVAGETLRCIVNCASTNYSPLPVLPRCTDFSNAVGTTVGQRSDTVLLDIGDDFTVAYQGGDWRPLETNNAAKWSIASRINLQRRTDNGRINNAPVATMMSPINIPRNQPTVINVPIGDADGDTLRCRWSTGTNECKDVCPPGSLPPNTQIFPNCTIIITGQQTNDWFAVTLMVEDFISPSSLIPLSSVPVQFLVRVVSPPSCTIPPEILGVPEESSCTSVQVGQTFNSFVLAKNSCPSPVVIDDIATLSFPGMIKGNLTQLNSSIYSKTLTWTPTLAQLGYQVMCAMAFDRSNFDSLSSSSILLRLLVLILNRLNIVSNSSSLNKVFVRVREIRVSQQQQRQSKVTEESFSINSSLGRVRRRRQHHEQQ